MSNWLFPDVDATLEDVEPEAIGIDTLEPADIPPGTNILVAGPAMTGKRRVGVDIITGSASRTACIISTKQSASAVDRSFRAAVEAPEEWDLSIIDCTGRQPGLQGVSTRVTQVASPSDLTGIGIALTGLLQEWDHGDVENPRVQLHSVSTLLMYTNLKRVFRFLHVIGGRLHQSNAVSVFTLDTTSHGGDHYNRLAYLFDAVVEIRESDDGREFRVRGGDFGPRSWTAF